MRSIVKLLAWLACALVSIAGVAVQAANDTSTDHSDLWGTAGESGWGIQFVQQHDTVFATMFVYGSDQQPTWYIATLTPVDSKNYAGAVYRTHGPYFGGTWDATATGLAHVGSMNFYHQYVESGTLSYTIDGVSVLKAISRSTFAFNHLGGNFLGGSLLKVAGGDCTGFRYGTVYTSELEIVHAGGTAASFDFVDGETCAVTTGAYTQAGQFGSIRGAYTCTNGDSGTMMIFESSVSYYGLSTRIDIQSNGAGACHRTGYFAGVAN